VSTYTLLNIQLYKSDVSEVGLLHESNICGILHSKRWSEHPFHGRRSLTHHRSQMDAHSDRHGPQATWNRSQAGFQSLTALPMQFSSYRAFKVELYYKY